ncbi:MAG: 16S rRNA (cytidine(1402)-2'-O)-methyltransferase, partial [Flavobacteriaceae bacterium]|nr:16S rRNA (cytidine(1402)-2'-O)-methyltransferase [Flavobacteriaceae bacterium]
DDITIRGLKILETVDLILCEDTRRSKRLLNHFNIESKLRSHHKFNEHKEVQFIVEKIKKGQDVALISDAGTPGISDPGFLIARTCLENNIDIECLPGATALIPALLISGISIEKFVFEGFLPVKKGRKIRLDQLKEENRTMVFYESPHKLIRTLNDFSQTFGLDRKISVSRELTKIYEETVRGTISELINHYQEKTPKGEFVIVLDGKRK